ncbi:phosphatase PAP2 family protein [soil metagenome]
MLEQAGGMGTGRARRVAWSAILLILLVDLVWLSFSSVSVLPLSLLGPLAVAGAMAAAAWYYRDRRGELKLADAIECTGQMTAFMGVGALLSYLMATLGFPLQDAAFQAADRSLGLDWLVYLKAVDARPWLGALFALAYASFLPQVLILIVLLCFTGRGEVARIMVLAMMLAGAVTIFISGFAPAMAMFVHLGLGPADYPNLSPGASFVHVDDMRMLRSGAPFVVDLSKAQGIITFPSYHAALGLLMLLGGYAHPWLRLPFVLINLTMIAATPIDGGHYFFDVSAGLAIACAAHVVASRLVLGGPAARHDLGFTGRPHIFAKP